MAFKDEIGTRMKEYYEQIPKTKLMRRMPVIIRLDGKAFHSFTKGFRKPFDDVLVESMQETMRYLCENIQGCVLGYTQSDEITLILVDYQKLTSQAWFDYEVQKMCSIAASMATMKFNEIFDIKLKSCQLVDFYRSETEYIPSEEQEEIRKYHLALDRARSKGAMFDARCFNIPKEEVANLLLWRQLDATRNSIQMVGQANFSHKELQGKTCNQIQDMLHEQKNINWNDCPTYLKRGSCCIKVLQMIDEQGEVVKGVRAISGHLVYPKAVGHRTRWIIDKDIPEFKGEGRKYIERFIYVGEQA